MFLTRRRLVVPLRQFATKVAAAPAAAPAPAPAPAAATPAAAGPPAAAAEAPGEKRLHSSDIAFKPTENGWGFSPTFSRNYDNIFGKKAPAEAKPAPGTSAAPTDEAPTDEAPPAAPPQQKLDVRDEMVLRRILSANAGSDDLAAILGKAGWRRAV